MESPRAEISGTSPKIEWDAARLSASVPVDRYVVIRIQGPARDEVCRDADAPAGGTLTYVVHATRGARWAGEDSKPSNAVVVPGPSARTNEVSAVTQPAPGCKIASTPAGTVNRDAKPADDVPGAPDPKPTGEPAPTVAPEPSTSPSAGPDGTGSPSGANSTTPPLGTN